MTPVPLNQVPADIAATQETLFQLPTVPDEFGILLAPSALRRIKFSALDFSTARRAIIEYIQAYFPKIFNDFVTSSGAIMFLEIVAAEVGKMALRGDIQINEAFFKTCTTEAALTNHLALIGQRFRRQTPALVDIAASVDISITTDIRIDAGTVFSLSGSDKQPLMYEIYKAPGDWTSQVIIPAGKRGVIAYGLEGQFVTPQTFMSSGRLNQIFTISDVNALEAPIIIEVLSGVTSETWTAINEPIERYGPKDKVVEVNFVADLVTFRFGDDIHGKTLSSGQQVLVHYRAGGGIRGRIGSGIINESRQISPLPPATAPVTVTFRNPAPSNGGLDKENLAEAKIRGPRTFAAHDSIVTDGDYAHLASTFSHPVYGSILKAVATIRTSLNANLVEIYALAVGPGGLPTTPSLGLKRGLTTFLTQLNVLTDKVSILNGVLHPVNIDMTVVVNKNADASVVKNKVESTLDNFFDVSSWGMGQALYVSNLVEAISAVDGVSYVDLISPPDNILPIDPAAMSSTSANGIVFNELIVEGTRVTRYYYESSKYSGRPLSH